MVAFRFLSAAPVWAAAMALLLALNARAAAPEPVSFNEHIRPILTEHCLKCHSGVKEAGKLNLQFREAALKAGSSGELAIVPGAPGESEFLKRLLTSDEDDRMPKDSPALPPEQVELVRRWIAEGAMWEEHWAYEQPRGSGRSIDSIVTARLRGEKLGLSPEAERRTLARRTALDITGLPPTPEQVERFVADRAPDAYERWVDGLLGASAYGERWATVWLDLARYADSKGYESDGPRDIWRYRDWVIDALNEDKPYNEFLIEQLAGDLLPEPKEEQVIATAFHRNTPANDEGGTDDEEFRTFAVLDRLTTTFDAVQGTTIGCVQCHGHPYDPFVHQEFYQLYAFFNNTADADRPDESPTRKVYKPTETKIARELEAEIESTQKKVDDYRNKAESKEAFEAWVKAVRPAETVVAITNVTVTSSAGKYLVDSEGIARLEGEAPERATITVEATIPAGEWHSFKLRALTDEGFPGKGPGFGEGEDIGNFILTEFKAARATEADKEALKFARGYATFEEGGWGVGEALKKEDGPKRRGWAIKGGTGKEQTATFILAQPLTNAEPIQARFTLEHEHERRVRHVIGAFQLAASKREVGAEFASLPEDFRNLVEREPQTWSGDDKAKLQRRLFSERDAAIAATYKKLDERRGDLGKLDACKLPVMEELTGDKQRKTQVFHRGNWMDKKEEVQPGTPRVLNKFPENYPKNRLGLAKWLTNGENPLTARVQVNRVWEQLFGIGLVETLEDFGTQGDRPIYQDLLDELAVRFQTEMHWSQKQLLREIVMSRVYRQSAKASAELVERDPANRFLARGPRFRLSAEQLRDQALAVSGLLSSRAMGPPVMPFQPPGVWVVPYSGRDWETSKGEESKRRAVYTFVRRAAFYPSFASFDAPSREFCAVRRLRTNTPLQSLDLLNNPVFFEAAGALAARMRLEGGWDLEGQIARGVYLASLRPARPDEVAVLKKLHDRVGGNMQLVANAILNLDEVINKN